MFKEKTDVFIAGFPYGRSEDPDVGVWLAETVHKMKTDPRVGAVLHQNFNDTPITMTRNQAVEAARAAKAELLVMIDSDMRPDLPGPPGATHPFWDSSFDFWLDQRHNYPGLQIAAPYVGPPPHCNMYVFQWAQAANPEDVGPDGGFRLEQYAREEAAVRIGFERCAALPTGLILIDMRVFDRLKPDYFYYEWTCPKKVKKASTEDVTFTRDADLLAGCPNFVNWYAWAGHHKRVCPGRPQLIYSEQISHKFKQAARADVSFADRDLIVQADPELERQLRRQAALADRLRERHRGPCGHDEAGVAAAVRQLDAEEID